MLSKFRQVTKSLSYVVLLLAISCSSEVDTDPFLVKELVGTYTNEGQEKLVIGYFDMTHVYDLGLEFGGSCIATISYEYVAADNPVTTPDKKTFGIELKIVSFAYNQMNETFAQNEDCKNKIEFLQEKLDQEGSESPHLLDYKNPKFTAELFSSGLLKMNLRLNAQSNFEELVLNDD